MLKLMPRIGTITNKQEIETGKDGKPYVKLCVAIGEEYYWCTAFAFTAKYIDTYANIGAKIFLDEWCIKQNKEYTNFIINKIEIVKNAIANGGDK